MRRILMALLLAPSAAHAQETPERDLPDLLARRGWFDVAREQYERMANDPRLSAEQRADGRLGLALLAVQQADREPTPARRLELIEQARTALHAFADAHAAHPRRHEAVDALAELLMKKARLLAAADPDGKPAAEAFAESRRLYKTLIEQGERDGGPPERVMYAKLNYGLCLFAEADTARDVPARRRLLAEMNAWYSAEVIWQYDGELAVFPSYTLMGRAHRMLAETSDGAAAEGSWRECFAYVEKGARMLDNPDWRKLEDVREIAVESAFHAVRARLAFGDSHHTPGRRQREYRGAAQFADSRLKLLPVVELHKPAVHRLRLEAVRALLKAAALKEGLQRLDVLSREAKGVPSLGWLEDAMTDLRAEFAGDYDPDRARENGDNLSERGFARLPAAVGQYRIAARTARHAPYSWNRIGDCYAQMGRWIEAATAYAVVLDQPESAEAPRAALERKRMLDRLARSTGAPEDRERARRFLDWAAAKYPKEMGATALRDQALVLEEEGRASAEKKAYGGEFLKAAEIWTRLAGDATCPFREEATFRACLNRFLHAFRSGTKDSYGPAIDLARRHLQLVENLSSRDATVVRNATGSVLYGMWAGLLSGRPADALALGERFDERFPAADRSQTMRVLQRRIEALVALDRLAEADAELEAMERRFEKDALGLDALQNARAEVARACSASDREDLKLRAAEIMLRHLRSSTADPRPEELAGRAEVFFAAASRRSGDEARRLFLQALEMYERLLVSRGARMTEAEARIVRGRITECLLRAGRYDQVLKELDGLERTDPEITRGWEWEALGDARAAKADALAPGAERNALLRRAVTTYHRLFLRLDEGAGEPYWRVMWKYAQTLSKIDLDGLASFFEYMRRCNIGPAWDEGKFGFKEKLEELRKRNEALMPNRRRP